MTKFYPFTLLVCADHLESTATHDLRYDDEVEAQKNWVLLRDVMDPPGRGPRPATVDVYDARGVTTLRPDDVRSVRLIRNPEPTRALGGSSPHS